MKKLILIVSGLIMGICFLKGQDPQFSQFYAAKLNLASAFSGTTEGGRVTLNFRDQWPQIPREFISYAASIDYFFPNFKSGAGLLFFQDKVGDGGLTSTNISIMYSYHIALTRGWHMRPGMKITYINRHLDFNDLVFGDQLTFSQTRPSTSESFSREKINVFDFETSFITYSDYAWIGVSIDHLQNPDHSLIQSESVAPLKISVFGGGKIYTRRTLLIKDQEMLYASFLYRKQDVFQQFDLGAYWETYPLVLGLWYRGIPFLKTYESFFNQDAVVIKIGYIADWFSIAYSYDYTISRLISSTGGAHEISISYLFNQNRERSKRKIKALPCPRF